MKMSRFQLKITHHTPNPLSPLLFLILIQFQHSYSVLEVLSSEIIQEKEMKGIQTRKEEIKLFADEMITYVENTKKSTHKES